MYVRKIELVNIKSFKKFKWELSEGEDPAGWHVLLGDNGSGKSTFIRAAAVVLMGWQEALKTQADFAKWILKGQLVGSITLNIEQDSTYDIEARTLFGNTFDCSSIIQISDVDPSVALKDHGYSFQLGHLGGWFSASYGPFRRFTGGNNSFQGLFMSAPLLARHLSVFGEGVALTGALDWLKRLKFKKLEDKDSSEAKLLGNIITFLNQNDFLPNNTKLDSVNSDGVIFIDGSGYKIDIESLSDGYRSILSMMLELIRQMTLCYKTSEIFNADCTNIDYPGVVFIDEIDVHLHPKWQRKIGLWLTKHFPRIQFIVTTHSPLICQSATNGSIWRLPNPGQDDDAGQRMEGVPLQRLLYGDILEALSSGAFGDEIDRSDKAQELLEELAELNVEALDSKLSVEKETRREELQKIFGMTPNIT